LLLELVLRGTISFLALLGLMRIVGQREAGALGIADVLLVVLVATAAAPGLEGGATSVTDSMVVVVTILFWSVVVDAVAYRSPRLAGILKARPRTLIHDGPLNRRVMRRELMTGEEVLSQLRLHGIQELSAVERANIEPNGMISVVRKDRWETSRSSPRPEAAARPTEPAPSACAPAARRPPRASTRLRGAGTPTGARGRRAQPGRRRRRR
jgi:uncharacterized membrane protein YcaP (DUF421 family)